MPLVKLNRIQLAVLASDQCLWSSGAQRLGDSGPEDGSCALRHSEAAPAAQREAAAPAQAAHSAGARQRAAQPPPVGRAHSTRAGGSYSGDDWRKSQDDMTRLNGGLRTAPARPSATAGRAADRRPPSSGRDR